MTGHIADISKKAEKEDCISRRAAIDALDMAIERYDEMAEEYRKKADIERNDYMDMRDDAYEARQLAQWLNELKYLKAKIEQITIMPEPHWIPCSERMPKESGQYLITVKYEHVDGYEDIYAEHGDWNGEEWDMFCFGHCGKVEDIVAWQPLPEPYRKGEKE